jgi:hypothetical protein
MTTRVGPQALPEIEDGDRVLVRGSPFGADRLMEQAEDEHLLQAQRGEASPRYAVSVVGALKTPEVSADKLIEDILTNAPIRGRTIDTGSGAGSKDSSLQIHESGVGRTDPPKFLRVTVPIRWADQLPSPLSTAQTGVPARSRDCSGTRPARPQD